MADGIILVSSNRDTLNSDKAYTRAAVRGLGVLGWVQECSLSSNNGGSVWLECRGVEVVPLSLNNKRSVWLGCWVLIPSLCLETTMGLSGWGAGVLKASLCL